MPSASAGEITIDSNHESTEQIQASLDLSSDMSTPTETPDQASPETVETSPASQEVSSETPVQVSSEDAPAQTDQETDTAHAEDVPKKTAKQRRRKDATAAVQVAVGKQREAERRAAEAEERLAALTAQSPATQTAPAQPDWARYKTMPGAPTVDQFEQYDDYTMALTTFVTDMRAQEHATRDAYDASHAAEQEADRVRESGWQTRLQAARKSDPTFDDHLNTETPMSMPMQYLTMESPVGTELLRYLSSHQDESQRLSTLHPVEVYREMGKLEERLGAASEVRGSAPVVSHAKPPIKPLGSSPHTPDADAVTDELSFDEHFRRMNAADRKHGRL
jgi:hypothetical protein